MKSAGESLRLAYADDVAIWENLNALERFRFASEGLVIPDGSDRSGHCNLLFRQKWWCFPNKRRT